MLKLVEVTYRCDISGSVMIGLITAEILLSVLVTVDFSTLELKETFASYES